MVGISKIACFGVNSFCTCGDCLHSAVFAASKYTGGGRGIVGCVVPWELAANVRLQVSFYTYLIGVSCPRNYRADG